MSRSESLFGTRFLDAEWECLEARPRRGNRRPDARTTPVVHVQVAAATSSGWILPLAVTTPLVGVGAPDAVRVEDRHPSTSIVVAADIQESDRSTRATLEAWNTYLDSLSGVTEVSAQAVETTRRLWASLRQRIPSLIVPAADPLESGTLQLVWDAGRTHVDVDVLPNGAFEWFYRDRTTGLTSGEDDCAPDALPDALCAFLGMLA